ncbi:transglycosylase SLT domain-containing protein [Halomonas vilamensis]|uniref:Transglycosylase SLT domain-containing protein n=1 Tax=Vreelandella vilamensis TaxID=531309 RepID=A0ABU1H1Y1_9GAMM|nr:transglycosylase SLT domain-containing protein [Halomonas vilamensis]MDR5898319.1 transglycosylase SLT domain-containing protein [Halomonas vilamensis]
MTNRTIRQRLLLSVSSTTLTALLLCVSAQSQASAPISGLANKTPSADFATTRDDRPHFWESLALEPQNAWSQLRNSFAWQDEQLSAQAQARVDKWIAYYRSSPENIATITERATPWLAWITQQINARNLPGEIALIPFIESSFDPSARSHRGAAGLWQFMPGTGDALGLIRNGQYDGRLDVVASTQAALDYIEMQADQWYEGDLSLSLAAYNAGAGRVNRAVRDAQSYGKSGQYWDLQLPDETMHYVPKLHAIATIIADPERYNVILPDIEIAPAFAKVRLRNTLTLREASKRLDVDQSILAELNPGLLNDTMNPRHGQTLLVPNEANPERMAKLALGDRNAQVATANPTTYRVERGDNLSTIAARHNLTQQHIMRLNAIERPDSLQPGQLLTLSDS